MNKKKTYVLLGGILLCMLLFVYMQHSKSSTSTNTSNHASSTMNDTQTDLAELLEEPKTHKDNTFKARTESFSAFPNHFTSRKKDKSQFPVVATTKRMPELVRVGNQIQYPAVSNRPVPSAAQTDLSKNSSYTTAGAVSVNNVSNGSASTGFIPKKSLSRDEKEIENEISPDMRRPLSKLTYQEQKKLDFQINKMSDALDRAILRAITPKNKQDEMIEKYLQRREQNEAGNASGEHTIGGFPITSAEGKILNQLARQSKSIINSIQEAYGEQAGTQAAQIMQQFQQEMQEILSGPGTMDEKQERAKKLNKKYNQKLQKLAKQEGQKKLNAQKQKERQTYLRKLQDAYGSEVAKEMQPAMDEYLTKREELLNQGLTDAEFIEQDAILRQQLEEAQRKILSEKAVGGTANVTELQNNQAREQILDTAQQIADGKITDFRYMKTPAAQQVEIQEIERRRDDKIVPQFQSLQSQAAARNIMNTLIADKKELEATALQEGWSKNTYDRKYMELVDRTNESIKNLFIQEREQQYNANYEAYYQNLPEEKKAQYRVIWEAFNRQRANLQKEQLTQEQLDAKMQEIQEREQQAFARIE